VAVAWGSARLAGAPDTPPATQPSLLLVDGAARSAAESTLDRYLDATAAHLEPLPTLVVWPESALTVDLEQDPAAWTRLRAFADTHGVTIATGGVGSRVADAGEVELSNAVHVVRPRHGLLTYRKRILVPFAESWPFAFVTPPASIDPVTAGDELLIVGDAAARVAPRGCFEMTDAATARTLARRGARVILNVNNDAYWGAAAPHLVWARIRAVESGLPVARATNGGVGEVIDPFGRVTARGEPSGRPTVLRATLPEPTATLYARTGEVFLPACFLIVVGALAPWRRRLTEPEPADTGR
jgi:apolipoprotein N-acyltransferase